MDAIVDGGVVDLVLSILLTLCNNENVRIHQFDSSPVTDPGLRRALVSNLTSCSRVIQVCVCSHAAKDRDHNLASARMVTRSG